MITRITPTGWGRDGGRPVYQHGSTEAVLRAMGWDGVLIVADAEAGRRAMQIWRESGKGIALRLVYASGGPDEIRALPPNVTVGVDVEAWRGGPTEMWLDIRRVLQQRRSKVIWG